MQQSESAAFAVEEWPVDRPQPCPDNPRVITDAAVRKVAASLQEFGWRQPIVVDEQEVIVIGHTRRLAAITLGMPFVPVHVARGLSPEQIRALRLADNRTGEEASWDLSALAVSVQDLECNGFDLALTGFDTAELQGFGDAFAPELSPVMGHLSVTEEAIDKTRGRLETRFQDSARQAIIDVACPHCSQTISLNRDAL